MIPISPLAPSPAFSLRALCVGGPRRGDSSRHGLNRSGAGGLVSMDGIRVFVTFEEFFRERYVEVVRSLRLVVGDDTRAEELAQEAFTRAFRRWSRVSALDRPVAWVYVVATNEARRAWRRD